jgi:transposase
VPPGGRAKVGNQVIREYTYVYLTVCPQTGEHYSLILPYANQNCMNIFMQGVSEAFSHYRIVMVMDGAGWHTGNNIKKMENIVPLLQPPYSPEVNPVENVWHHIREDGRFKNATFNTLEEVELKLVEELNKLNEKTVKSITLFKWIKNAIS